MTEDPDFRPIDPKYRAQMNLLAQALDDYFNPPIPGFPGERQRRIGFFLTCFEFNNHGRFNYISNAEKLDVKAMLQDIVARIEAREAMDAAGPPRGSA